MKSEVFSSALKNTLTEIRNVCPGVTAAILLDKNARVVASDAKTPSTTLQETPKSFGELLEKAETLGGLNSLVIEGSSGSLHISATENMYLTIAASKQADLKYVEITGRVLVPTILKILDGFGPTRSNKLTPPLSKLEEEKEIVRKPTDTVEEEEEPGNIEVDLVSPEIDLPSNQLIVESFSGLFVSGDTVQIGNEVMSKWQEMVDGKDISHVEIESFDGKTNLCKVKAVDDSKLQNRSTIRVPEKLCQTLDIKDGELVRVKPLLS